ncbi:MAG: acyloxyacyl hydrolase [Parasulfuritortus sp.]|nr:acyloxyacyl hydrolase [Parasulfuritortus sp.]
MRPVLLVFLITSLAAAMPSQAIDGYFTDIGGASGIQSAKIGMIRQWHQQWLQRSNWHMTGYWEAALAYLKSDGPGGVGLADASVTPVFRLRPDASGGVQPYLDAAIGLHVLSRTRLDDNHAFGNTLQFGPLLGLGVTFGEKSQYDFGYRFQHLSNAGIAQPNDGVNLQEIRLTYLY